MVDIGHFRQHSRHNLNATGTVSDDSYPFILCSGQSQLPVVHLKQAQTYRIVVLFIPRGTVKKLALKVLKTRYIWPFPVVKSTSRLDENIGPVTVRRSTFQVLNLIRAKLVIFLSLNDKSD